MSVPHARPHVVFAGGGTGGHLFPGLAVAERLAADVPRVRITFAGTGREFERQQVAVAGFDYLPLRCRPWPKRLSATIPFLVDNFSGYRTAARFIHEQRVQVVVGLGGYASVPMARAATAKRLPLVLLEQNVVPGRATRWLARSATLVCTAFHQAHPHLPKRCHVRLTGNPIRAAFLSGKTNGSAAPHGSGSTLPDEAAFPRQLLILGGSGGAQSLNENVPHSLQRLRSLLVGWRIVHQSGQTQFEATRQSYARLNLPAKVVPFVDDMPALLRETGLAVCRAGGTTLAELAAAGVPGVLLPYPHAADDHQRKNADCFATAGACLVVDERELGDQLVSYLAETIRPLLTHANWRRAMSDAMRRLAHPDAAWDVAAMVRQLAG